MTITVEALLEDFELLGDWEARYRYLVELGERLPPLPAAAKTEAHRVKECMSTVYVLVARDPQQPERLRCYGDCDTAVIKGVVALLIRLLDGKTPAEVAATDIDELFVRLRLAEHLSPNRHVGVFAIVRKLQEQARALAG